MTIADQIDELMNMFGDGPFRDGLVRDRITALRKRARASAALTCRACGCTDDRACITDEGPCAWVMLDIESPTGICSACAEEFAWHPKLMITAGMRNRGHDDQAAAMLAVSNELRQMLGGR